MANIQYIQREKKNYLLFKENIDVICYNSNSHKDKEFILDELLKENIKITSNKENDAFTSYFNQYISYKENKDFEKLVSQTKGFKDLNLQIFCLLCLLEKVDKSHSSYGMAITNFCFRIFSSKEAFDVGFLFYDDIKTYYTSYSKSIFSSSNNTPEIRFRWAVSSSLNFALFAFFSEDLSSCEKALLNIHNLSNLNSLAPVCLWNLSLAYLLLGILSYIKNHIEISLRYFNQSFYLSRQGLCEIYHPKNEAILTQTADCRELINIGEVCLLIQVANLDQEKKSSMLKQSSFQTPLNCKVNLKTAFKRYRFIYNKSAILNSFEKEINQKLVSL